MLGAGLPARAQTLLHLSETASAAAQPDEVAATLRADVVASSAADAQRKVNAAMADALERTHRVAGVIAATSGYTVWRVPPTPPEHQEHWQAEQTLSLHAPSGPALLELAGDLQQRGLATSVLGWRLSDKAANDARQRALADAIKALRGRAETVAGLLGLQFDAFKEVRIDAPAPIGAMRMLAAAQTGPQARPPSAEADVIDVSATVDADVLLKPR